MRLIRRVLLTMGRKNAKTTLIAALVLVHLVGPESGQGQQIYSAANDREQAAIIYRACEAMVLMDEDLSLLIKCVPSRKRLVCYLNGSFYQALSADAKTKHGMNPAVWIYDELAQAPKRDLYDALDTSQGAQAEPLGFVISTQAIDPQSQMSILVDDALQQIKLRDAGQDYDRTLAAFIFTVPPDADPFDESLWKLANPALGDFLSLQDMRDDAAKARRIPSLLARFRNLRLNQQVDGVDHIFGPDDWKACGVDPVIVEALRGRPCFGGLDLSSKHDLTAFVLVFPDFPAKGTFTVLTRCWTPQHDLDVRSKVDTRNEATYRTWSEQGHLIVTPGRFVDYDYVANELADCAEMFDIKAIAYDSWNMHKLETALRNEGVKFWTTSIRESGEQNKPDDAEGLKFVRWRQGMRTMAPALEETQLKLIDHKVSHGMHPVLTWAATNAVAVMDAAGNTMPAKNKSKNRIDPVVAMCMAFGVAALEPPPEDDSSIFDDMDALREALRGPEKKPAADGSKKPEPAPVDDDIDDEELDDRWHRL